MNEREFWSIVESARRSAAGDTEARVEALATGLAALDCSSIQAFQHQYDQVIHRANRWDLWGAAYLMNGGCSDDGFRYFCHWLISEGEVTFVRAVAEPDTLAELPRQEYFELESFGYVAVKQFEAKCGGELERDFSIELAPPAGEEWSEEDLPALFPKLAAKYGEV
jgi:Protein of unknown function (DUF4240)